MGLATTLETLRENIEKIQKNSPLAADQVRILGASKGQPPSLILEAIESGMTDFGENRVQEAEGKWEDIKNRFPNLWLHLIGPLQTNKVKQAVALFDVIQTIDRIKLADALADEMQKAGRQLPCFIQVNIGKEPQKAGVMPEDAATLIEHCTTQLRLNVVGLMCVPQHDQPPAPHFASLRDMAQRHALPELSMGMSDDFETAIRMGSTCIRLGRILFGERS